MPAAQQVFEETVLGAGQGPAASVDWAAQRGEAEHVQVALRYYQPVTSKVPGRLRNVTVRFDAAGRGALPVEWLSVRHVGPSRPKPFRVLLCAARTLNAPGQSGSRYRCGKSTLRAAC